MASTSRLFSAKTSTGGAVFCSGAPTPRNAHTQQRRLWRHARSAPKREREGATEGAKRRETVSLCAGGGGGGAVTHLQALQEVA